jgi:uncharacterized protein YbbC (DUF1343 family)
VRFVITDRDAFDSVRLGLELAYAFEKLYPGRMAFEINRFLIGNREVTTAGKDAVDPRTTLQNIEESLAAFMQRREKFLLYK